MARSHSVKKRIYLAHPEPDIATVRRSITRIIPPSPPPVFEPPPPPPVFEPLPPPPPPPPPVQETLPPPPPPPEPEAPIDVISVDVDPSPPKRKARRRRSRSRSSRRESREREVYIERDHFIPVPYPVRVEPKYETYRYIDGPRRHTPQPPDRIPYHEHERRSFHEDRKDDRNIRLRIEERERSHDHYH